MAKAKRVGGAKAPTREAAAHSQQQSSTHTGEVNEPIAAKSEGRKMTSFAELAQVSVATVERPKPIPEGHYQALITGPAKEHKAKSGNLAFRFPFKLVAAGDDVDAGALEAAGGLPDKEYYIDFWMSPDARWRFTEFGKAIGAVNDNMTLTEAAEAVAGCGTPFLIQAKQEASQDNPEAIFTRFDNPTAA